MLHPVCVLLHLVSLRQFVPYSRRHVPDCDFPPRRLLHLPRHLSDQVLYNAARARHLPRPGRRRRRYLRLCGLLEDCTSVGQPYFRFSNCPPALRVQANALGCVQHLLHHRHGLLRHGFVPHHAHFVVRHLRHAGHHSQLRLRHHPDPSRHRRVAPPLRGPEPLRVLLPQGAQGPQSARGRDQGQVERGRRRGSQARAGGRGAHARQAQCCCAAHQ
mmetsp:Transcript_3798/g.12019  ORF Transcript_3798/g.12019 Transcript_3798/m.12019 type:complete len:216 (-) Transcript_3798:1733-2380(-)